ncbi:DUF5335 domain-containing protein [Thiohalobacter sp. IOR34]|uniref:DUF5335 domain-containing protein n=1 Tax=Thiohalobacter sp. IOR34 TaxID=3057176 RepID=UPI0025B10FFF|nr:DUF5335 domain-containing protein [Thiohalobacter sp. IOR34]WJW76059.1 DUF5335 domain-containing protein [Thiohalobacter sp. IOR34]
MRKLEQNEWKAYFDRIARGLGTEQAEIEVAGLDIGDQLEADRALFIGIDYDPKDDVVEVAVSGLDHLIRQPREIYVDEDPAEGLRSLEVVDADGHKHIVQLKAPLRLPAP